MNKVVEVYSLKRMCRAVVGNHPPAVVEFHSFRLLDDSWLTPACIEAKAIIELSEVHRIHTPDGDRFIAMEPKLREILEAPFEAEALAAQERERHTREWAEDAVARATERTRRMLAMPWWRRMWFAAFKRNLVS